jgi:hypothetical protein
VPLSRIHADILGLIAAHRDPGKLCRRGYAAALRLEWVADSHYRFFPTLPDERFGHLHPVALAMNKVMAAEFRLFLPNEIIITGVAGLARMYRPSAVDRAAEGYHDWLRLAGPGSSHRQLTLRADRSAERPACGALISRPTVYDGGPRSAVRTLAYLRFS